MAPVLAYWDIRGLAQPIRLLLAYTGTEFEDKYYVCGPAPDYDKSCWFDVKYTLGLDFPNLPYYIDGDVKLTQSNAILRYIGGKHNLLGSTEKERIRVNLMENELGDFRSVWVGLCYNPDFENLKSSYHNDLPQKLGALSKFLGGNKWLAGENITIVDFILYEMLDQHLIFDEKCLNDFGNLNAFHERFRALEKIEAYMKSKKFISHPLNNKRAKFGNQ
nr:GSTmu3a protein [Diaphanosoma celebensis]